MLSSAAEESPVTSIPKHGRIPHYEIGWSVDTGWWVQVQIHNSTMYKDRLPKMFENCASPEHALALANEWIKENLSTTAEEAKSLTASQRP